MTNFILMSEEKAKAIFSICLSWVLEELNIFRSSVCERLVILLPDLWLFCLQVLSHAVVQQTG